MSGHRLACLALALLLGGGVLADEKEADKEAAVREVEKAVGMLNEAFVKQDAAAIGRLMTADHVAVTGYYGGPQTRAQQLKSLKDLKLTGHTPGKVGVKLLGKDAALVTYPVTLKGTFRGRAVPARNFVCSVWLRRGGQWRQTFYQETPLTEGAKRPGDLPTLPGSPGQTTTGGRVAPALPRPVWHHPD